MKEIRYWTSEPRRNPDFWAVRLCLPSTEFHLVYDDRQPDYLFVTEHIYFERLAKLDFQKLYSPNRVSLFWAGECISPDFNLFDYAMTYDKDISCGDRFIRRPVLSIFGDFEHSDLRFGCANGKMEFKAKSRFCNFIYSNPDAHPHRDWLFYTISQYERVDSLGPHLHNCECPTSRWVKDFQLASVEMKRPYKFSISSENACFKGYTSEKIITSFLAHSIPIYWGNPDVESEFNPKSFINANGLSRDDLMAQIRYFNENENAWSEIIEQPPMTAEQFNRYEEEEARYRSFMCDLFSQPIQAAHRSPQGYWPDNYRRTLFGASARQVTKKNRIYKAFGRETRPVRWVIEKIRK